MLKLRWYVVIGLVSYCLFLAVNVPARWVLPQPNQLLPNRTVQFDEPQGTLWEGSISLTGLNQGAVRLAWSLDAWQLLLGRVGIGFELNGAQLVLNGQGALGFGALYMQEVQGQVGAEWINLFAKPQGVSIQEPVQLDNITWKLDLSTRETQVAQGVISWRGGPVSVAQGTQYQLPELKGALSEQEGSLRLEVARKKEGDSIIICQLMPNGWAKVTLLKRLLSVVGLSSARNQLDKPLLEVQQKVF